MIATTAGEHDAGAVGRDRGGKYRDRVVMSGTAATEAIPALFTVQTSWQRRTPHDQCGPPPALQTARFA
jgi:hypothetical protein